MKLEEFLKTRGYKYIPVSVADVASYNVVKDHGFSVLLTTDNELLNDVRAAGGVLRVITNIFLSYDKVYSWSELTKEEQDNLAYAYDDAHRCLVASKEIAKLGVDLSDPKLSVADFKRDNIRGLFIGGMDDKSLAKDHIVISKAVLSDRSQTLITIIHELCHHFGRDGSRVHQSCIEEVFSVWARERIDLTSSLLH